MKAPGWLTTRCRAGPSGRVHRVLDLRHLHDQVGGGDQVRVGVAAGDDHVLVAGRAASVATTSATSSQPHFIG